VETRSRQRNNKRSKVRRQPEGAMRFRCVRNVHGSFAVCEEKRERERGEGERPEHKGARRCYGDLVCARANGSREFNMEHGLVFSASLVFFRFGYAAFGDTIKESVPIWRFCRGWCC